MARALASSGRVKCRERALPVPRREVVMAEAALAHDDEEAPSGFFLTEPTLPPSPEPRLRVQSIASRMQRMAQEIALLQGMGSASLLLPEQGGGAQGLAVWPLADGQLNAPDIADALEEIQRELEDAEEERKWKDILNERVALAEAIERHDGSAERERKELQEYLEGLRARVREAGISFSDEEYSRLVAAGEAAGADGWTTSFASALLQLSPECTFI